MKFNDCETLTIKYIQSYRELKKEKEKKEADIRELEMLLNLPPGASIARYTGQPAGGNQLNEAEKKLAEKENIENVLAVKKLDYYKICNQLRRIEQGLNLLNQEERQKLIKWYCSSRKEKKKLNPYEYRQSGKESIKKLAKVWFGEALSTCNYVFFKENF